MISVSNVRRKCCEQISDIEGYAEAIADTEKVWECHHRIEVQNGHTVFTKKDLIEKGLYFHRPACELIFLHPSEHATLHRTFERRKKQSEALKGKPKTKEHLENFSKSRKGVHTSKSVFSDKYYEHYHLLKNDNRRLHYKEKKFFDEHGYCSWEQTN